jgi:hypothetical protein
MSKTLLSAIIAGTIAFSAMPAQAGIADEILLGRLSGTTELAQGGAALVSFVEGRPLRMREIDHVAPTSLTRSGEQADRYYHGSVLLTLTMLVITTIAFAGVIALSRGARNRAEDSEPTRQGWRDEVIRMMESDLTNLDGLRPGA